MSKDKQHHAIKKLTTHLTRARFTNREQTLFAKRMSFLVKAGVPLIDGLSMIRDQMKVKSKIKALDHIINDVNNGQFLAMSLRKHPRMFSEFAVNLIKVGEESGILSQNLAYLADELEKKEALRRKVIGALIYPLVITFATFGITGILIAWVFPKILPIFESLHATLPLSTRILITVSTFLGTYGPWILLGLLITAILYFFAHTKIERIRVVTHHMILRIPLFGKMVRSYNLANFSRTLGLLLRSGVHLSDALVITAETTKNLAYRKAYEQVALAVVRGEPISRELERNTYLFPDILPNMVLIGETTGNLSNTFIYLSELYEDEVESMTKNLSNAIEPFLMIVMGLVVGFIAISIITPIYEITQNLG